MGFEERLRRIRGQSAVVGPASVRRSLAGGADRNVERALRMVQPSAGFEKDVLSDRIYTAIETPVFSSDAKQATREAALREVERRPRA